MSNVFQVQHLFMLSSPCAAMISLAMALSQHGSLPDPAADTHAHFVALPHRPHTLEEAIYTGGLLVGEVVEWAKGLDPSPTLIHIDMREPECAGALRKKGWATDLWQQLVLAPELRTVRLIPAPKTVDSLWGVMSMHGTGKLKSGVCTIYPTTNLVHCPPHMDMIALNQYFPADDPKGDHSSFPFQWQTATAQWWDDLGIFPSHREMPPLHHIPDITLPTLHQVRGLSWYRGLVEPPPSLSLNPLSEPPRCRTPPPPPPMQPLTPPSTRTVPHLPCPSTLLMGLGIR